MMTVDTRRRHQQVAGRLRDRIDTGDLAAGALVPSERELAAEWGFTRPTVNKALQALEGEGRIFTSGGRRYVREHNPIELRMTGPESRTWLEDVARAGRLTGPAQIRVAVEDGHVVRYVLRDLDGEPHNHARWEFPFPAAHGSRLAYDHDIEQGSVRYLEEGLETPWDRMTFTKAYESRPPVPGETAVLGVPPGFWVTVEYRTGTQDGTLVFASVRTLRADRTRLIP